MTAYQLSPDDRLAFGGWAIPHPWAAQLQPGQTIHVEIAGRLVPVKVTAVRTHYAIAHEVRP